MKITNYILIGFVFIFLLFSVTTYINFRLSEAVTENVNYVAKSTEISKNSSRFFRNMIDMVSGLRGYLLTGERYFVESYDSAASENDAILAQLSSTITDSSQSRLLNEIIVLNNTWVEEYTEPLKEAKALSHVSDSNLAAFNLLYRDKLIKGNEKLIQLRLQSKFREFTNYEYDKRARKSQELQASVANTRNISFTLTVLSLVSGVAVVIFLVNLISSRIGKMVTVADSIAQGNYNVAVPDSSDELSSLIRALNHMASELSKNIATLEAKNKELSQFAHIVSHDLKGPLRGIDNVINWINEDHTHEISPKIKEYISTIKNRVVRAENLIQGILSYARVDTEIIETETVDINILLQEILDNIPIHADLNIRVEKMPVLHTEKLPLFQIFSNLIDNAIKYNDKLQPEIKIYYKEYEEQYEFFVADNGPGIAENYHGRIFIIFQTLKDRDTFESTGVGLAIVKKILDARNETIKIYSEPGKGAIFCFTWQK